MPGSRLELPNPAARTCDMPARSMPVISYLRFLYPGHTSCTRPPEQLTNLNSRTSSSQSVLQSATIWGRYLVRSPDRRSALQIVPGSGSAIVEKFDGLIQISTKVAEN